MNELMKELEEIKSMLEELKKILTTEEPEEEDEEPEEDLHGWIGGWHRYIKEYPEPWSFDAEFGKEDLGYIFDKYEEE